MRNARIHMMICLLLVVSSGLRAQQLVPAGITADKANRITEPTALSVQSGSNYIRFGEERLPAVVTYTSSEAFGAIPTAMAMGDTIKAELVFADCGMAWRWSIEKGEGDKIVEIKAHESASIEAIPHTHTCEATYSEQTEVACDSLFWGGEWRKASGDYEYKTKNAAGCDSIITMHLTINHATKGDTTATACEMFVWHGTTYTESAEPTYTLTNSRGCDSIVTLHLTINHATKGDTTATACEMFVWHGTTYTESAEPTFTLTNSRGCDSIVTLYLTVEHNCGSYDTAYFCRGFNSEHEELMAGGITRRYRPYVFKSPAEWNYMDGVILEGAHDRTLVDLAHAEANLYEYYKGELTPISSIRWSVMYDGKGKYEPLTVTDGPQWIATGYIAVQVCFLCGEMYNTEFPTDIDQLSTGTASIKRIENGRVVIIRGGAKYDMFGTKIQ